MEFQILDVDYVSLDEKPVLRIFGKGADGKTVCGFYEGFVPYFYLDGSGAERVFKGVPGIQSIQTVKRFVVGSQKQKELYKITITNPAKTPEYREMAVRTGMVASEADILFKYRFMNDLGLNGLGWVKVDGSNGISTSTVSADTMLQIKEIEPIQKEEDAPLKYLAFDIECIASTPGQAPDARDGPIIMVSLVFSESYKGSDSIVLSTKTAPGATALGNEKELLEEFIRVINEFDPDILTGFNCNNFDIPYILERMKQLGVNPVFGRCKQKDVRSRNIGLRSRTTIAGRIIVDSFELVKKDFSLKRYGLDFVSNALLKERKDSVKHSEIEKLWVGDEKDVAKLVRYCRKDSVLALKLVQELKLTDKYAALSKVSGTLLQDSLDSGETTRIENYVLREFNKAKYVMPCKPSEQDVLKRGKGRNKDLGGGAVLEPTRGLHTSVVVLDFKAMYPSIVKTFNVCPTTLVTEGENLIVTPSGAKFLPKDVKVGIIPQIVDTLMTKRQEVKKVMGKAKKEKARQLYAKQWALKIMANAIYGYFGYSRSRLFSLDIANAITSTGRDTIAKTKESVEKKYGYDVVYGDTDSVFVKVKEEDLEKIEAIGIEVSRFITSQLTGSMELEFEKVFKRFLPLTKKRYAAWAFYRDGDGWKDNIETKGIETVRRDWCGLVGETVSEVLEILLKKDDVKGALAYFKSVIERLLRGDVDMESLVITKTMTRAPEKYMGIQPHIELVKKMRARDPASAPGIGDRIGYVIVKGTTLLSKRTEDPEWVKEKGLQLDSSYYIENQLLPPIERLFGSLGISKSELLGNGKQLGILDILRKAPRAEAVTGPVPLSSTNGFVCLKCSKFYQRVPLSGVCSCGGEIRFSSPDGPVSSVLVG